VKLVALAVAAAVVAGLAFAAEQAAPDRRQPSARTLPGDHSLRALAHWMVAKIEPVGPRTQRGR
jgi:hypothetical protein